MQSAYSADSNGSLFQDIATVQKATQSCGRMQKDRNELPVPNPDCLSHKACMPIYKAQQNTLKNTAAATAKQPRHRFCGLSYTVINHAAL